MTVFVRKNMAVLLCGVWLAGASAWANSPPVQETGQGQTVADKKVRRGLAEKRATDFFGLLTAEVALNKGDVRGAQQAYMILLERTKRPEVAERAMEIAVARRDERKAEEIYQRWLKIDSAEHSPALRRMAWTRNMSAGRFAEAETDFAAVLEQADERQRARLFLLTAQAAVDRPQAAAVLADTVNRQAERYPDLPEAAVADVVYSAIAGQDGRAAAGLRRLAELDNHILPPTETTLRLIGSRYPKILQRFFAETDVSGLSDVWREAKLEMLTESGQYGEAYRLVKTMLEGRSDSKIYMTAAFLADKQKVPEAEIGRYFEKAYQGAEPGEQGRIALLAAVRQFERKHYDAMDGWLAKLSQPEFAFDKAVLALLADTGRKRWSSADQAVRKIRQMPEKEGSFLSADNLYKAELAIATQQDDADAALAALDRLSRESEGQDGFRSELSYYRGLIYADVVGDVDKAVAEFRTYLAENPDSPQAQNALGYTLLGGKSEGWNEALALIEQAYRSVPDSGAINDSLGWAYFKQGDSRRALPYLTFAFKQEAAPETAAHLGEVLWHLGRKAEAERIFVQGGKLEGNKKVWRETVERLGVAVPAGLLEKRVGQ